MRSTAFIPETASRDNHEGIGPEAGEQALDGMIANLLAAKWPDSITSELDEVDGLKACFPASVIKQARIQHVSEISIAQISL